MVDTVNFQSKFGGAMSNLDSHKNLLMNELWLIQLDQIQGTAGRILYAIISRVKLTRSGISYAVDEIRCFLSPYDHTITLLVRSSGFSQPRAEFTCEWFDNHLMSFIRSNDKNLVITGKPGAGKTVLTGWIVERLQRLQGAKSTDVLSYKIREFLRWQGLPREILTRHGRAGFGGGD